MAFVLAGMVLGGTLTLVLLEDRATWLASLEFTLQAPPVPAEVLATIQKAEAESYRRRPALRRGVEELQDVLVFAAPGLAYRLDFSVGRYRIKAETVEQLLPWAQERGYLRLRGTPPEDFAHALAYFSEQPGLNDWQASVYLEWLRLEHPQLSRRSWPEIASEPLLVAKLYSGYMGAGDDWEGWKSSLTPGPEAKRRLGLQ